MPGVINERGAEIVLKEIQPYLEADPRGASAFIAKLRRWDSLLRGKKVLGFDPNQMTIPVPPPEQARARAVDPDTSHEAAKTVNLTRGRQLVLEALDYYAYHKRVVSDEMGLKYVNTFSDMISPSGYRTRRKECVDAGWVESTGEAVENRAGRAVAAWRITAEGRRVLREGQ